MTPSRPRFRLRIGRPWRGAAIAAACVAVVALGVKLAAGQGVEPRDGSPKLVSATDDLSAAIAHARPGDTLRLKGGTYTGLALSRVHFDPAVHVTSADPAHPATVSGMILNDVSGLVFSQVKLDTLASTDPIYGFRLQNCGNLVFDDVIAYGNLQFPPSNNKAGFYITRSSNIRISNSQIVHMGVGITANNNNNIVIKRNLFSEMSKSGIGMGAVSFVSITDNVFTNFMVGRGTHPDGIQIYTATMPTPSHDLSVVGNLIYRGRGNAIQGIFIQDEGVASPFETVTVADNAVIGGMWDSIYVKHVNGALTVKDNVAASWPGLDMEGSGDAAAAQTPATTTNFEAYLWLRGDLSGAVVSLTGNRAQVYMDDSGQISPPRGNLAIGAVDDGGKALVKTWLAAHPQLAPLLATAQLP